MMIEGPNTPLQLFSALTCCTVMLTEGPHTPFPMVYYRISYSGHREIIGGIPDVPRNWSLRTFLHHIFHHQQTVRRAIKEISGPKINPSADFLDVINVSLDISVEIYLNMFTQNEQIVILIGLPGQRV
jgi:hypothetical protein